MEVNIEMSDWNKAEQIRHIATGIVQHITHHQNEDAIQDLVNFASLIYTKDMSEYVQFDDIKDINLEMKSVEFNLKSEIKLVEANLNTKIDKVESSLNAKIDKVEANLNAKIDKVEANLNVKIDKVEANLNAKIDKVEANLNAKIDKVNNKIDKVETNLKLGFEAKILESQNTLIKWFVSLFLTQFTGMVFLFLKLSGKF